MYNYELIVEEIKSISFLSDLFFFTSNDKEDEYSVLVTKKQRAEFSHVHWIYLADHTFAALIGILKNGSIFTVDSEFDKRILCPSFFDLPFVLAELEVFTSNSDEKEILLSDDDYSEYVKNLKLYSDWCKKNNYSLSQQYFNYFD